MTNETTASQPKSIGDDAQFCELLDKLLASYSIAAPVDGHYDALVAYHRMQTLPSKVARVTPALKHAVQMTRQDLGTEGLNYPFIRELLKFAEVHVENSGERSIAEDTKFMTLLNEANYTASEASVCGNDFGTGDKAQAAEDALITYIDSRAPAAQASATIQAEGGVDWLGLALALEDRAKTVESQTTERSMAAAARGLRLMGAATIQEPVMVAEPVVWHFREMRDSAWQGWVPCDKSTYDLFIADPEPNAQVRALGVIGAAPLADKTGGATFTENQLANACAELGVPDSTYESMCLLIKGGAV